MEQNQIQIIAALWEVVFQFRIFFSYKLDYGCHPLQIYSFREKIGTVQLD